MMQQGQEVMQQEEQEDAETRFLNPFSLFNVVCQQNLFISFTSTTVINDHKDDEDESIHLAGSLPKL